MSLLRFPLRRNRNRRGIVLVMILGILAIMVIMAVSFAVAMRTERLATANASENVRMRMLLDTALARAMESMRLDLTNQVYPLWDVLASKSPDDWDCSSLGVAFDDFFSGAFLEKAGVTNMGLLYDSVTNYIPLALLSLAIDEDLLDWPYTNHLGCSDTNFPVGSVTNIVAPRWIPVVEPTSLALAGTNQWEVETVQVASGVTIEITNVISRVLGRVGWVIVNCSGLIDVNFTGEWGSSNTEDFALISIANLPEIASPANIASRLGNYVRYDTLNDFYRQNSNDLYSFPSNLFIYSHALSGYATNNPATTNAAVVQPVSLAGSVADLEARRDDVCEKFLSMGFNASESGQLFTNLLDYVDADCVPRLPNGEASAEAMPLPNEVVVAEVYKMEDLGGGSFRYTISNSVQVELWFPYVSAKPAGVSNRISVVVTGAAGWTPPSPADTWLDTSAAVNGFAVSVPVVNYFAQTITDVDPPAPNPLEYKVRIANYTYVSNVLLRTAHVLEQTFSHNSTIPGNSSTNVVWECIDPRLGGLSAMWTNRAAHTLGALNYAAIDYWSANPGCDSNKLYFCANTGLLFAAELCNLPLPGQQPWRSMTLFGSNRHDVLDCFSTLTNAGVVTNEFRGMMNPNSTMPDALACAFNGMSIREYPGGPALGALPWIDAQLLAGIIIGSWPYTNLSDIGAANWDNFFAACSVAGILNTPQRRETFLGNVANVLNVRQNVFAIVLAAELAGQDNNRIPKHPVRGRAVAVVWRDPYLNKFFIRSFKYLQD